MKFRSVKVPSARYRSSSADQNLSPDHKHSAYEYISKLYHVLESESNTLLSDPVYKLQINYSNDTRVKFFTYFNHVIMVTYLFIISLGSIREYLEMLNTSYINQCYDQEYYYWLFINYSDNLLGLGPISYSIIYTMISFPLIYLIGLGDEYYKRQYYFFKYERYKHITKSLPIRDDNFVITWNHKEMYNKQRREYIQGSLCLIVAIIMSFTARDMQSLIINSVSVQFIAQIDEMIFRYILLHIYKNNIAIREFDSPYNDLYV